LDSIIDSPQDEQGFPTSALLCFLPQTGHLKSLAGPKILSSNNPSFSGL
jgi:hypothetical protein